MSELWQYFRDNQSDIAGWTWTTVWLAGGSLLVGLLIALPLGWVASRYRWSYPPLVTLAGLVYTIPSIVLFVTLPGLLGTRVLDPINVGVALTAYTVALLVRVVADGLTSVSGDLLEAAAAMGYTGRQRLFAVQFPISIPVIGAGLRVAAVSNVSLISVASLVGVQQLGALFVRGSQTVTLVPIVLGVIIIMLLAFAFDAVILLGIRLMTPWQRAVRAR
ncbi:MAG: osmoprotectant transport system permease protein [Pseudonocardiales bacterium]|jgi:osmoprotectant transport system permease protein|nr:binding-protein-dependent transport system inner rane component [Pseudonocardiales bacterium]MDT4961287.1 osmoprotectant transport system permease protein [Pseudonocardiales bacterium]MDT4970822.1 osmoprotectant transport system permease protein [Pseudonocardiales bacterium]MDT4977204.1 osmoprotectant transport system permease protein [Pseudonocardiales bacterium]MDT4982012.1 osmoprotectant transport system permease protein [Pseudonocardiales bacterium]